MVCDDVLKGKRAKTCLVDIDLRQRRRAYRVGHKAHERISSILEPDSSKEYRKNWARLIQKIYEVDPLTCPKCSGKMKVISVIEGEEVTRLPWLKSVRVGWKRDLEKESIYRKC